MQKLLLKPRAVAGLTVAKIDQDTCLYELEDGRLQLHLLDSGAEARQRAQDFIAQAYQRVFAAELRCFYPSVITLHDVDDNLLGAAGARYGEGQTLFLEQYLDAPAEQLIGQQTADIVDRAKLVEIGNLSVARPAMTYPFMGMIGSWLQDYDVDWLVFALTRSLRRLFHRAGAEMLDLGPARPERLKPSANRWGSYYEHDPCIMAVRLSAGLNSFLLHHRQVGGRIAAAALRGKPECRP